MLVSWLLLLGAGLSLFGRMGGLIVGGLFFLRLIWMVLKPIVLS
jgi:hypothetical protein